MKKIFKKQGGWKVKREYLLKAIVVCFTVLTTIFSAGIGFCDTPTGDPVTQGKHYLIEHKDVYAADVKFLEGLDNSDPEIVKKAKLWRAITIISSNAALKNRLKEFDIISDDVNDDLLILDKEEDINYNGTSPVANIIIDNGETGWSQSGTWTPVIDPEPPTGPQECYGNDFKYAAHGTGANTVTWTPTIVTSGSYDVYVWIPKTDNNTSQATYTINDANGSSTININQRDEVGEWVHLGSHTYRFNAGTGGSVVLSDNAPDGNVCADAIKLEYKGTTVDDHDTPPTFTLTGTWGTTDSPDAWWGSYKWHAAGGNATAKWTPNIPETGEYLIKVNLCEVGGDDYASNAQYTIHPNTGTEKTLTVDQRENWGMVTLGVFTLDTGTGNYVTLTSNGADGKVIADGMVFYRFRTHPNATTAQNEVVSGLSEIGQALVYLGGLTDTFQDTVDLHQTDDFGNPILTEIDYGDVLMFKAGLNLAKADINLLGAYNMNSIGDELLDRYEQLLSINYILNKYKDLGKLADSSKLADAKAALIEGINRYFDGYNSILNEPDYPDGQGDDLISFDPEDSESTEAFNAKLDEVLKNLNGTTPSFTISSDDFDMSEPGDSYFKVVVNLRAFFDNPTAPRSLLPSFDDEDNLIRNSWLYPTFGGVLPNMTVAELDGFAKLGSYLYQPQVHWTDEAVSIILNWKKDTFSDFVRYKIYRFTTDDIDESHYDRVYEFTNINDTTYTDTDIDENQRTYYYRLYTYYSDGDKIAGLIRRVVTKIYVDIANTSGDEDGSPEHPYKLLRDGIDAAGNGAKICVAQGTYPENEGSFWRLSRRPGIVLEGGYESTNWTRNIEAYPTIIDGTGLGGNVVGIWNVSDITIDGFTIKGAQYSGIGLGNATGITVRNCTITNNLDSGIGAWNGSSLTVENCRIMGNARQGIRVDRSTLNISDSTLSGNDTSLEEWTSALDVYSGSALIAARLDVSQNNGRGITVTNFSSFDIRDSRIADNLGRGLEENNSSGKFFNNLVGGNGKTGIYCAGFDGDGQVFVENNTIVDNGENGGIVCERRFAWLELDNQRGDETFTSSGNWTRFCDGNANWGEYLLCEAGSGASATWIPDIKTAGTYNVYATWVGGAAHSSSAAYEIHYDGGTDTVSVDQKTGTTGWQGQLLGQYHFAQGKSGYITLRQSSSGQVVADAVKFEYVPTGSETFTPALKNNIVVANNRGPNKRGINSYAGANPVVSYNDVYGHTNGNYSGSYTDAGNNISADPQFVSGPLGDYYLTPTISGLKNPCVDSGSDTSENLGLQHLTTRRDGEKDRGIVDLGYHYLSGKDEVIIDFGNPYGIWIRYNDSDWLQLHNITPEFIVTGDLDGNGKDDIVIDFGSTYGIWIYYNNSNWVQLHSINPEVMEVSDLDGNGKDDIIVDFGNPYGIWIYYNNSTWTQLHSITPESMVNADLDANGQDDLVIDFGNPYGIWIYYNNSTWTQLHNISPECMVTGDLDNNGKADLIIDFGDPYGIWIWKNNSSWVQLHNLSPEYMITGDLDGTGQDDLIIDFGDPYGIWIRYNDSTWAQLHNISPDSMVTGDMDNTGKDEVIIDFGPSYGVWIRYNNSTWSQLHSISPDSMVTGDIDGK